MTYFKDKTPADMIAHIEELEEEWQCADMDLKIAEPIAAHIEAIYYQAEKAGFDREAMKVVVEARYNGGLTEDPEWTNRETILTYLHKVESEDPRLSEYPLSENDKAAL